MSVIVINWAGHAKHNIMTERGGLIRTDAIQDQDDGVLTQAVRPVTGGGGTLCLLCAHTAVTVRAGRWANMASY